MSANSQITSKNIFSFDVEEWFHLRRTEDHYPREQWGQMALRLPQSLEYVLDLLDRTGNRATFFWLGWCAERYPKWVRRVADAGHEIACHGYGHTALDRLTPDEFRAEIRHTRSLLEDLAGQPVQGFRAPSLSLGHPTAWMLEVLIEEGFRYDSSLLTTSIRVNRPRQSAQTSVANFSLNGLAERLRSFHPWHWTTESGTITELPLSVRPCGPVLLPFGGGFFFRCAPYWAVAATLKQMNARGEKAIFYAHPWELDEQSPLPTHPRIEWFSHRFLLPSGRKKYLRLLKDFHFVPAVDYLKNLNT